MLRQGASLATSVMIDVMVSEADKSNVPFIGARLTDTYFMFPSSSVPFSSFALTFIDFCVNAIVFTSFLGEIIA